MQGQYGEAAACGYLEVFPLRLGIKIRPEDVLLLFGTEGKLDRVAVLPKGDLAFPCQPTNKPIHYGTFRAFGGYGLLQRGDSRSG